jgi:predicted alpha/beta-hydrolase family hydrolase
MSESSTPWTDVNLDPPVRGFLHTPASPNGDALILTHGAGANCESPLLVAVANAFREGGFTVLRCDLPFRQVRPHGPPPPGSADRDQRGLRSAVDSLRRQVTGRVFLGGHSYGGRQATLLAASQPDLVAGLLLLSYPLHPPKRPQQLRTAHFPQLRTPALFFHGTRDGFGTLEEMTAALHLIPAKTRLIAVASAGHELLTKANRPQWPELMTNAFLRFFA